MSWPAEYLCPMYSAFLARFSRLIEVGAERLVRREIVVATAVVRFVAIVIPGPIGFAFRAASSLALLLILALWLGRNYINRIATGRPQ
jgi:hypothetical protein